MIVQCDQFFVLFEIVEMQIEPYYVAMVEIEPNQLILWRPQDWNNWRVRFAARNENTPALLLELLSVDEIDDVRYAVASNLNTPMQILQILFKDSQDYVRLGAAMNISKSMPVSINMIINGENSSVCVSFGINELTVKSILAKLK